MEKEKMSFWEHLEALRRVLFQIAGLWLILFVVFFACMPHLFDAFVLAPCSSDFITYEWMRSVVERVNPRSDFLSEPFRLQLVNIQLTTPFFLHISTAFWFSIVASVPFILWRIWGFVQPALYPKERQGMSRAFFFSSIFFYAGAGLGYFLIFPITLHFLSNYTLSEFVPNQISLTSYMDNFLMLILLMGLAFQLPLLLSLLHRLGILSRKMLVSHRRHAMVVLLILSAIITPTGDPFTLSIVALPLYLLYECSILMMKPSKG